MGTLAPARQVAALLQLLPAPLLRALDRWSHRRAVTLQVRRQQAWLSRKAPPVVVPPTQYRLKPWRD